MPDLGEKRERCVCGHEIAAAAERDEARQQLAEIRLRLAAARALGLDLHGYEIKAILADPACGGPEHGDET